MITNNNDNPFLGRQPVADKYLKGVESLKIECTKYIDSNGFMTLDKEKTPTDNPYLITATFLYHIRWLDGFKMLYMTLSKSLSKQIKASMVKPGLPSPQPSWSEPTLSHDEFLGCIMALGWYNNEVLNYGRKRLFIYNNLGKWKHTLRQCMLKFPTKIAFLYSVCDKIPLNPLYTLYACIEMLVKNIGDDYNNTSGKCMMYLMADYWYKDGGLKGICAKVYLKRLEKQYKTLDALYSVYFGPNHPITLVTKGKNFL